MIVIDCMFEGLQTEKVGVNDGHLLDIELAAIIYFFYVGAD